MPRAQTNKLYRTFVKGLITEAGFLTYPEDASVDELNTVIYRKGNRSRRLGIDYEPESTAIPLDSKTSAATTTEYFWEAVDNDSSINFICLQVDNLVYFLDASSSPVSEGIKAFVVDLSQYSAPSATLLQIQSTNVHMAAGKGYLFIAQQYIDPIVIEYDPETDTIEVTRVIIQIRDFDGVNDGLANDEEPSTLSKEHHYNLMNQGWVTPGTASTGTLPGGINTDGEVTYYDPWTGNPRTYERFAAPEEV